MGRGGGSSKKLEDAYQARLQEALSFLDNQAARTDLHPNDCYPISQVARNFDVNYDTLRRRFQWLNQDAHTAHESQQLLSHVQERVILEWAKQLSDEAEPITKHGLRRTIQQLMGGRVRAGKNWIKRFLERHPSIKLAKPCGLDLKRAKCFNRKSVRNYFTLLEKVLNELEIPWENVWNMDEKGCQCGGGRKRSAEKYFIPQNKQPVYRQKSGNLELITVVECVNAVGDSIKPGFIFPGKQYHQEWMAVDPEVS